MTKHNSHEWKKEEEDGGRGGDGDGSIADVVPLCRMLMLVYGGQQVVARLLARLLLASGDSFILFGPSWQRFAPVDLFNNGNGRGLSHPIEMFFPPGVKIS